MRKPDRPWLVPVIVGAFLLVLWLSTWVGSCRERDSSQGTRRAEREAYGPLPAIHPLPIYEDPTWLWRGGDVPIDPRRAFLKDPTFLVPQRDCQQGTRPAKRGA